MAHGDRKPDEGTSHEGGRGLEAVSGRLRGLDLAKVTGTTELLRSIESFQPQMREITAMLETREQSLQLTQAVMGLKESRRALLGTAIGASASAEVMQTIGRATFANRSTQSLGLLAGAQLSNRTLEALAGHQFKIATAALKDAERGAAYRKLGEQFYSALSGASGGPLALRGFGEAFRSIVSPMASSAWKMVQRRQEELDERAIVFVERHGWPLPLALPVGVIYRVVGKADRGKREVQQFMCRNFGPRTKAFRTSRDRLFDSEHFRSRRRATEQGIQALNRGHYYAAICTLLPLVEGVLVDVVLSDAPPRRGAPKKAFAAMQDMSGEFGAALVTSVETLVVSASSGSALFGDFERRDYGGAGESRSLNRHAILHGAARRYGTHANALKLFLLLVALAEILDIYEDEQQLVIESEAD